MILVIICTRARPREIVAWTMCFHSIFPSRRVRVERIVDISLRPPTTNRCDAILKMKIYIEFVRRIKWERTANGTGKWSGFGNRQTKRVKKKSKFPLFIFDSEGFVWHCFLHRSRLSYLLWEISSALFVALFVGQNNVWSTVCRHIDQRRWCVCVCPKTLEKKSKLCLAASGEQIPINDTE